MVALQRKMPAGPPAEASRRFGPEALPPPEAHPRIVRLLDYYRSLVPGPGLLPGRQHFDPLEVPQLLPHLWLIDLVPEDPRRWRVRLVGTGLIAAGATMRSGQFFSDWASPREAALTDATFSAVVTDKRIDWRRGRPLMGDVKHIEAVERVILPLARDGMTVDMLLCMSLFHWSDGRVR